MRMSLLTWQCGELQSRAIILEIWKFGRGRGFESGGQEKKVMDKAKSKTRESARKEKSEREDPGEEKKGCKSEGSKRSKSSKTK